MIRTVLGKVGVPPTIMLGLMLSLALGSCVSVPNTQSGSSVAVTTTLLPDSAFGSFTDAVALSRDRLGNIYVLDRGTASLIKYGQKFDSIRAVSGLGRDHYQFDQPTGIDARQSNNIYIADYGNHRIEQYSREMAYNATLSTREDANPTARFGYPLGVALDDGGNIFIIDGENKRVVKMNSSFLFDRVIGSYSGAARPEGVLTSPSAIAVDGYNTVLVLDNGGKTLVAFDNFGSPLKRAEFTEPAMTIRAWDDSIVVLRPPDSSPAVRLKILHSRTLETRGIWLIPDELPPSDIRDISVMNGSVVILMKHRALVYHVRPE